MLEVGEAEADRDIIDRIGCDLPGALTLLRRRYGTPVYRFCREALRDRALADDTHQQIFIQAHRDLPRFAARASLRTWLFAIVRHRVLDAAKMRRRAEAHLEHGDAADPADLTPTPDDQLDTARLQRDLSACLDELDVELKLTVLARYQQGLTFEQMAELFDRKPGTLQAKIARILPRLRDCLERRGHRR
ncbi:MAG TPA: sigma-70 family RNA polymerase sigma factor [Kofleriaceae bacterium]|nr:sigma-70 family RNA polymerase sigma factor [Kofleriaceae bacterium]